MPTEENALQIACLVLMASHQGLPQVKEVLRRALERARLEAWWTTPYRDLVLCALDELRNAPLLYIASKADLDDEHSCDAILEAFLKCPNMKFGHRAGYNRSVKPCGSIVARASALTDDAEYLDLARHDRRGERFCTSISQALAETCNAWILYLVGKDWSEKRFTPKIAKP